jgi:hypothetical protein
MYKTFSPTSLQLYLKCPWKWYKVKIEKEEEFSIYFVIGSIVHNTIENLLKKEFEKSDMIDYVHSELQKEHRITDEERSKLEPEIIDILKTSYDSIYQYYINNSNGKIEMEKPIFYKHDEWTNLTGRIDLFVKSDENITIIDYKTTSLNRYKTYYEPDWFQWTFYASVLKKMNDYQDQKFLGKCWFVRTDSQLDIKLFNSDLDLFYDELIGICKEIQEKLKKNEMKPKLNKFCNWCFLKDKCPLQK